MKTYKVTNKSRDLRKFFDTKRGFYVFVEPGEFETTKSPPKESNIFEVSSLIERKKSKKTQEVKEDGS